MRDLGARHRRALPVVEDPFYPAEPMADRARIFAPTLAAYNSGIFKNY